MPSTRADMRARIMDEMMRPDLSTQVDRAITSAIETYQHERWHWAKRTDYTITTVVGTDNYELDSRVADLIGVRYSDGSVVNILRDMTWDQYRAWTRETPDNAPPTHKCIFGDFLYVYPPPAAAGDYLLVDYWRNWPVPTTDTESTSDWMNEGEQLIRWRAKAILCQDVTGDLANADRYGAMAEMERKRLRTKNARRLGADRARVQPAAIYC